MELADIESRLRDELAHAIEDVPIPTGLLAAGQQQAHRRVVRRRTACGIVLAALVAVVAIGLTRGTNGPRQDVVAGSADDTATRAQPDNTPIQTCTATYRLTGPALSVSIANLQGARSATVTATLPDGGAPSLHADLIPNLTRVTLEFDVSAPPTQVSVELAPEPNWTCIATPAD